VLRERTARRAFFCFALILFVAPRAYAVRVDYPLGEGDEGGSPSGPLYMRTFAQVAVHAEPKPWSPMIARVDPGAVLELEAGHGKAGCGAGWMERASGGFVCAEHLIETPEKRPLPSPDDLPGVLDGTTAHLIGKGGANLYRSLAALDLGDALVLLFRGSVLSIRERLRRNGDDYLRTRGGMYARAANAVEKPGPILSLGVDVADGAPAPGGIVIAEGAQLRAEPGADGAPVRPLARWSQLPAPQDGPLAAEGGFIPLPDGFAADDDVARVREAPRPRGLAPDERWIAVDLGEQLLHAYVGDRLVRIVPCSTGLNGNTFRGHFRIQWKRRIQTMQLKRGHVRVEDVQWVMYYDKARSIAIHTATWHNEFGRPMSHGCVNLPRDDARWLYEWSSPSPAPEDSETFPHEGSPGTRVIVFG
jgi:hypothetical protein